MRREVRGVWVATVNNIDFPTCESIPQFQEAFIRILDTLEHYHITDLFFQLRPCNDAFYASELNPWSEYLTGAQGKDPGWDPLPWMVAATHRRGIKFHAWLNPYRVTGRKVGEDAATKEELLSSLHEKNFARKRMDLVVLDGRGAPILNPGEPHVKQFILDTIKELVEKYDIDGIHFDDYFYPYADIGKNDEVTYQTYRLEHESLGDFRRRNVDEIIYAIHRYLQTVNMETNRKLRFGVSPFAIWRNYSTDQRGSKTNGAQTYDDHYADTRKWVKKQWIDYIVPQVYWEIGHPHADYRELVSWWADVVKGTSVDLYIGLGLYRYGSSEVWNRESTLLDQLAFNRTVPEVKGHVIFSYRHFHRTDCPPLIKVLEKIRTQYWNESSKSTVE